MTMTTHVEAFRSPPSLLSAPATRRLLVRYVSRRVPACDVDDVVQATLCDALASGRAPGQPRDLQRWLLSIARFKVVDAHRAAKRAIPADPAEVPAQPAPIEARSLFRWAEQQLPEDGTARTTLRWMLREAEGDKLEAIAADEALPAERVRQRVSRLRRWMRERWMAEIALVAALAIAGVAWLARSRGSYEIILPELDGGAAPAGTAPEERLLGTWKLVSFKPAAPLSAGRKALADRLAPTLAVSFDGRVLHATAGGGSLDRGYATTVAAGGKLEAIEIVGGRPVEATYAWDGDELVLTVPGGQWAGVARFRR
jgi:DNA-directed RNA polymerase specialized sigma24 family protein